MLVMLQQPPEKVNDIKRILFSGGTGRKADRQVIGHRVGTDALVLDEGLGEALLSSAWPD